MQESARSRNAAGHVHMFYCMLADLQLLHTCTLHTMMVNNKLCGFLWSAPNEVMSALSMLVLNYGLCEILPT